MNKTTKTVIIIAVVIIIIGIIMCSIALFTGGRGVLEHYGAYIRWGSPEYQQQEYAFDPSIVNGLEVSAVADDVYLHLNTGSDEIKVSCTDSQYYQYNVAVSGDTLLVEYHENIAVDSLFEWGFFWSDEGRVDIWLPESFLQEGYITLDSVSGDVVVEQLNGAQLDANTVSGNIELHRCTFTEMSLETVSGDIEGTLLGNRGDYHIEYENLSGDVEINGPSDLGSGQLDIHLNTISGDIKLDFAASFTEAVTRLAQAA
ncbi:MAG: DUF4097 family beta strand repeat protein [Firmicutes bacterium]|nr:DUF4097 family beta strand repeat protein [Bacillota bacterium]